ncbi:MAG: response regulator transcription factor [Acidimicrobiales bacterium]|nr:response regulator transcription factor [Acidimicrobiales bacterium]
MGGRDVACAGTDVLVVDDRDVIRLGIMQILREEGPQGVRAVSSLQAALDFVRQGAVGLVLLRESLLETEDRPASSGVTELLSTVRVVEIVEPGHDSGLTSSSPTICPECDASRIVEIVGALTARAERPERPQAPRLSEREQSVLLWLAAGNTNVEIAKRLHVSASTVKQQASHIYRKLAVRNRAAAVAEARRAGWIE